MKRLALILLIPLALAGCASIQAEFAKLGQAYTFATTATVPAADAQVVISSFQVLEAGATAYFKYCKISPADSRCAAGTKDQPGPLRLAIKYDRQGRAARDQIKSAAKTNALVSSTAYNLLISSVNGLAASPASSFGASK